MYNSAFFRMSNMIDTLESKLCNSPEQKIQKYSFEQLEDGQVKVVMQVSRWHQEKILGNLKNNFPEAKALDIPHPKHENIFIYTIELTVSVERVTALVEAATKMEQPGYQLSEQQLEGVAYKFPPAKLTGVPSELTGEPSPGKK